MNRRFFVITVGQLCWLFCSVAGPTYDKDDQQQFTYPDHTFKSTRKMVLNSDFDKKGLDL